MAAEVRRRLAADNAALAGAFTLPNMRMYRLPHMVCSICSLDWPSQPCAICHTGRGQGGGSGQNNRPASAANAATSPSAPVGRQGAIQSRSLIKLSRGKCCNELVDRRATHVPDWRAVATLARNRLEEVGGLAAPAAKHVRSRLCNNIILVNPHPRRPYPPPLCCLFSLCAARPCSLPVCDRLSAAHACTRAGHGQTPTAHIGTRRLRALWSRRPRPASQSLS